MDSNHKSEQTLTVQVLRNDEALACYRLSGAGKKRLRIGRWPTWEIRVDDPGVARLHAIIVVNRFGLTLHSLDSRNPVLLNGELVFYKAKLTGCDEIRIGDTILRMTRGSAPQPLDIAAHSSAPTAASRPWQQEPGGELRALAWGGSQPWMPEAASTPTTWSPTAQLAPRQEGISAPLPTTLNVDTGSLRMSVVHRVAALPSTELLRVQDLLEQMTLETSCATTWPRLRADLPPPSEPVEEKYDTEYLIRKMKRERLLGRTIAGFGLVLAIGTVVVPVLFSLGDITFQDLVAALGPAQPQVVVGDATDATQSDATTAQPPSDEEMSRQSILTALANDHYNCPHGDVRVRISNAQIPRQLRRGSPPMEAARAGAPRSGIKPVPAVKSP